MNVTGGRRETAGDLPQLDGRKGKKKLAGA
jgi:hypothetical protein